MSDQSSASHRVTISREIQIDLGHRIPFHGGHCRNVHGHRYRIVATLEGPVISGSTRSDEGMVTDFGQLKAIMLRQIHDPLDHAFAVWAQDEPLRTFLVEQQFRVVIMDDVPTAENLARWCYERVAADCRETFGETVSLKILTVWETPNCFATCEAAE